MKTTFKLLITLYICFLTVSAFAQNSEMYYTSNSFKYAKLKPCGMGEVSITGGFWKPFIDKCMNTSIIDYYNEFEKAGYIDNFRYIRDQIIKPHNYSGNSDEFVYKWMEAAAYFSKNSPEIKKILDDMIDLVISIQNEDGYINTYYDNPVNKKKGMTHFAKTNAYEFYNFGHLLQAGIANFRISGDRDLLNAAIKFANLIVDKFSSPVHLPYMIDRQSISMVYEHPNHENALIELYRITGDKRYLNFALQTLNEYSFWSNNEIRGHAVRESLLAQAGVDSYLETNSEHMQGVNNNLWNDMYFRKMYITGAIGSRYQKEAFGGPYELSNYGAYAETCASVTNFLWTYKMLLVEGNARYSDCMERILYNGFLSGYGMNGTEYFYINPLALCTNNEHLQTGIQNGREKFFRCSCCPPNVMRLLGSLQQYIYTKTVNGIQVHLFINSDVSVVMDKDKEIIIQQITEYPWKGTISFEVKVAEKKEFSLSLRKPAWAEELSVSVNNKTISYTTENGYLVIYRKWSEGDRIELNIPMKPRFETGSIKTDNAGQVAICRGPIVYCIEAADNGNNVLNSAIPLKNKFTETWQTEQQHGFVQIKLNGFSIPDTKNEPYNNYKKLEKTDMKFKNLMAIPYYFWANRELGDMRVWIPIYN